MSLGDIFVEILGEMMGVPIKKKQQPTTSRPLVPPPVASSTYNDEEDDIYMYNDEDEEAEPAHESEIPAAIMTAAQNYEPPKLPTRRIPIHQEPSQPVTKAGPAGLPDGFVESIRTDKAAARAAIISAEIFGPPVSERRDRQW